MLRNLFDGWHIIVLAIVILLLFGWKKMPDMARSFGRSARILKSEMDGMKEDGKSEAAGQTVKGQPAPTAAAPTASAPPAQSTTPTDATPVSEPPANPVAPSDPVNQHPSV